MLHQNSQGPKAEHSERRRLPVGNGDSTGTQGLRSCSGFLEGPMDDLRGRWTDRPRPPRLGLASQRQTLVPEVGLRSPPETRERTGPAGIQTQVALAKRSHAETLGSFLSPRGFSSASYVPLQKWLRTRALHGRCGSCALPVAVFGHFRGQWRQGADATLLPHGRRRPRLS